MKINFGFESVTYPVRTVTALPLVGIISVLPKRPSVVKKSAKIRTPPSKTVATPSSKTVAPVSKEPKEEFSPEMERQYREWRRGGAAGPPQDRTLWATQFEKRLRKDLTGK